MLKRLIVPAVLVAVLATFVVTSLGGDERKHLTAQFPRSVSLYEGSDVRVLGVPIGTVEKVTPGATSVTVEMSYDASVKIPDDASAVIVSPSIVGDRFVQLTPVFGSGDTAMKDGEKLDLSRTSTPLELDEIYQGIDDLTVALGPNGANKDGALSDLLASTARNWGGQGKQFNKTIKDLGKLTGTLEDNKEELFGTAAQLENFIGTLAKNDRTVRRFNQSMSRVSKMLAGERTALASSLRNLAIAMRTVSSFVKENREILGDNISGLTKVTRVLVKQRAAVDEILKVAPTAMNNLGLTYNPEAGTLDTRANLGEIFNQVQADPETLLCGFVAQADKSGETCDLIKQALPRAGAFAKPGADPAAAFPSYDPTLSGIVEVAR